MTSIDPSKKLICQLVTGKVNPADPRLHPATWENLFPLANREGLAPLLYWQLQSTGWPATLPQTVRQSLTGAYYGSIAHNTLLFSELDKILPLLQRENIPALLVKGASLALDFYPERGLRPMVDVDCLVPRDSYRHAARLLRGLGYFPGNHDQVPGIHEMSDYHTGLKGGPGNRVIFELHWGGVVAKALRWAQAAFETNLPAAVLERLEQVSEPAVDQLVVFKQRFGGSHLHMVKYLRVGDPGHYCCCFHGH